MKIIGILLVLLFYSGCSFFVSRNFRQVIKTYDEFSLQQDIKVNEVASAAKLLSGNASFFIEFGADSCLVAAFARGGERYTVELVTFAQQKGALGAFFTGDVSGFQPVDIGYHARKSTKVIQCIKGHFIVSVFPEMGGSMSGAEELLRGLVKRIRARGIKPDIYEILPHTNCIQGSEFYFMGSKVFQMRFSSRLATTLNIDTILEGVAAHYTVENGVVELLKIRYPDTESTLEALNSYLKSRADRPRLLPREGLNFYTIIEQDKSEVYIAEYADWLYFMSGSTPGGRGQEFYEYVLRGGK